MGNLGLSRMPRAESERLCQHSEGKRFGQPVTGYPGLLGKRIRALNPWRRMKNRVNLRSVRLVGQSI